MYLRFVSILTVFTAALGFSRINPKKVNTELLLRPSQEENTNSNIFGGFEIVNKKSPQVSKDKERIIDVDTLTEEEDSLITVSETSVQTIDNKQKEQIKAKWFPIMDINAPEYLDGSLAGDVGFDPLGFASSKKTLYWMREAEIKHSRLAMLGALGWPLSEVIHNKLADVFHLESMLAPGGRAPSVLNGALSTSYVSGILFLTLIITGYLESLSMNNGTVFWDSEKPVGYIPGDYGFDPLNLYNLKGDKKLMETAEIKNGRLAMLAITVFAIREAITGLPVINF
jgi:hypothetical protein